MIGDKQIETKIKDVDPQKSQAAFNEKFQMKTAMEFDVF